MTEVDMVVKEYWRMRLANLDLERDFESSSSKWGVSLSVDEVEDMGREYGGMIFLSMAYMNHH